MGKSRKRRGGNEQSPQAIIKQMLCEQSGQELHTPGHLAGAVLRPREDQLYPLRFPEGGHTDGRGPRRHRMSRLQLQWEDGLLRAKASRSAVPTCQRSFGARRGRRPPTVTWRNGEVNTAGCPKPHVLNGKDCPRSCHCVVPTFSRLTCPFFSETDKGLTS